MSFRNIIANTALANVQSFLNKYDKPELVEEYVRAGLIYYGETPFLYRVFKPTDVPAPKSKERGGYKVGGGLHLSFMREPGPISFPDTPGVISRPTHPRHNAQLLWKARDQAVPADRIITRKQPSWDARSRLHGRTYTQKVLIPSFNNPFLQVERTLCMHSTGYFIEDKRSFSEKFWGHRTAIYIKLVMEPSDSRWGSFHAALSYSEDVQEKVERVQQASRDLDQWPE